MDIAPNERDFDQQASRSKPCPPKLAELIELVNTIPPESDLLPLNVKTVITSQDDLWIGRDDEWLTQANLALEACLVGLPETFRRYVFPQPLARFDMPSDDGGMHTFFRPPQSPYYEIGACDPNPIAVTFEAIDRYRAVDRWHGDLHRLARKGSSLISASFNPNTDLLSLSFLIPIRGSTVIAVDERGIIHANRDFFSEAIEGVELIRIRECEACKRIFWAGRIDQRGCSLRCNDILRKRRYRARYKQRLQGAKPSPKKQREAKARRKSTKKGK
jgi:hypothetical protein